MSAEGALRKLGRSFEKLCLMLQGYNYASAGQLLHLESIGKHKRPNSLGLSERRLFALLPFDAKFDKLFGDVFSLYYLLEKDRDLLPRCHCLITVRNGKQFVLAFPADDECGIWGGGRADEISIQGVIDIVERQQCVRVRDAENSLDVREHYISCQNGHFFVDGEPKAREEVLAVVASFDNAVVTEPVGSLEDDAIRIGIANCGMSDPLFLYAALVKVSGKGDWYEKNRVKCLIDAEGSFEGGRVEGFVDLLKRLRGIAASFNEVEYWGFAVRETPVGFKILQIDTGRDLSFLEDIPSELGDFLSKKLSGTQRMVAPSRLAQISVRYFWRSLARRQGFMDYMYKNWIRDCALDFLNPRFSLADKIWAHRRGFLSYRKAQYSLTEDNYRECLPDRVYRWLRPINNGYRKWLWDKVSLRYVLSQYAQWLPEYYFHVVVRNGKAVPLSLPDCPLRARGGDFEGVLKMLRDKGCLAMKPTVGSHGEGFFKLEYSEGAYRVNGREVGRSGMLDFLKGRKERYVLTEYVEMHTALKRVYGGATCTVRLMVINRTGSDPVIENAYYRIGTSDSGFTDNVGSGGVFAYVDTETGRYHDAESMAKHVIVPCPRHPDTGVFLEGFLPHWENVKKGVVEMCRYMAPLEYLGFDVVITETGFKVLEINTHQDLHRYPTYGPKVHAYFVNKATLKKAGKKLA